MNNAKINAWCAKNDGNGGLPIWLDLSEGRYAQWVTLSGKPIPFVGWFWRHVNFDANTITLSIAENPPPIGNIVVFDESCKYDYPYLTIRGQQVVELKACMEAVIANHNVATLTALYDKLQSYLPEQYRD